MAALPAVVFLTVSCDRAGNVTPLSSPKRDAVARTVSPAILMDERARADYAAIHYWDGFNFDDTAALRLTETMRFFGEYLRILTQAGEEAVQASLTGLLDRSKAGGNGSAHEYFLNLLEDTLYDAASAFRNDECYVPVARYVMNDEDAGEADRARARFALSMLLKNLRGQPAEEISYRTAKGASGRLHKLNREYTLVIFHNPGCHACGEVMAKLRTFAPLQRLSHSRRLDVLALYPDADIDSWKEHADEIPDGWINARDAGGVSDRYDLRAIPSLYLLDRDKRVLLKDADPEEVTGFLGEIETAEKS